MAEPFQRFCIKRYVLHGGSDPISVAAPIATCFVGWMNKGPISVTFSTEPYAVDNFDTIEPNQGGIIVASMPGPLELTPRFKQGQEIGRLKLDSELSGDSGLVVFQFVF